MKSDGHVLSPPPCFRRHYGHWLCEDRHAWSLPPSLLGEEPRSSPHPASANEPRGAEGSPVKGGRGPSDKAYQRDTVLQHSFIYYIDAKSVLCTILVRYLVLPNNLTKAFYW